MYNSYKTELMRKYSIQNNIIPANIIDNCDENLI